jgi:hypothetical protein
MTLGSRPWITLIIEKSFYCMELLVLKPVLHYIYFDKIPGVTEPATSKDTTHPYKLLQHQAGQGYFPDQNLQKIEPK